MHTIFNLLPMLAANKGFYRHYEVFLRQSCEQSTVSPQLVRFTHQRFGESFELKRSGEEEEEEEEFFNML